MFAKPAHDFASNIVLRTFSRTQVNSRAVAEAEVGFGGHSEIFLRTYEGCGRAYLGEVERANIIKLHRFCSKLSYLVYPDFDTDPQPALHCVKLSLRTRELDYSAMKKGTVPQIQRDSPLFHKPPILHRKETFLHPDHPLYAKFARLTRQEEQQGLVDDSATIGTRAGWEARLRRAGFRLHGHQLIR